MANVHRIIHEELKMCKICAKFVSMETTEQKESCIGDRKKRVERHESLPSPSLQSRLFLVNFGC